MIVADVNVSLQIPRLVSRVNSLSPERAILRKFNRSLTLFTRK